MDRYPYKLWRLCQKWNPSGFVLAVEEFLVELDRVLDLGYGLPLKIEALENRSHADALVFMLSEDVQDEIAGIFEHGDATSLDAERKHWQDRHESQGKVVGVGRASRDSVIRRYRVHRRGELRRDQEVRAYYVRNIRMNVRALAIERNPELFTRGRGQLHWESDISSEQRAAVTHVGAIRTSELRICIKRQRIQTNNDSVRKSIFESSHPPNYDTLRKCTFDIPHRAPR